MVLASALKGTMPISRAELAARAFTESSRSRSVPIRVVVLTYFIS
jgi:hypothetical protein